MMHEFFLRRADIKIAAPHKLKGMIYLHRCEPKLVHYTRMMLSIQALLNVLKHNE
jgi:hypothetical protein